MKYKSKCITGFCYNGIYFKLGETFETEDNKKLYREEYMGLVERVKE